jgi:hypothetical protein
MATYTVSSGVLVCIGTNITSAGILSALNSNGLGSGHFGQTAGSKDLYYFNSPIQIGSSSSSGSASIWNCSNEIIKINASSFRIYGTAQMGSYPSNVSTDGGSFVVTGTSNDTFRLYDNGIFRAYGSFVYAQNRIRLDNDTEFTIIDCDAELEDGVSVGESGAAFGARQQITYDRTRVHHTGAVGIKLYSFNSGADAAIYSLAGTRVEKCNFAFQLGGANNLSPVLKDVQINTCTNHIVPNIGNANVTFVNPDFTVLRGAIINSSDITTIAFRYDFKVQDASNVAIQNAKVFIVDGNNDVVVNSELSDSSGLINSHLFNYDGDICLQNSTFAGNTKTNRETHTRSSYEYGFLPKADTITINQDTKDFVALLPDANITESNKTTVDAYPITVSIVSNTINVTGDSTTVQNLSAAQLYDILASYLKDNFGTYLDFVVTRSGNEINATGYNVNFSYIDFTGNMVTDQVITLSNGSSFIGTFTDANGTTTVTELTLTGLQSNSEVRVYQSGTTTEIDGVENSGTTFATTTSASSVDIVVHALGYEYQRLNGVDTSQNLTLPISQRVDRNYSNP